jgi:RND family efflux transporter MFP subunit
MKNLGYVIILFTFLLASCSTKQEVEIVQIPPKYVKTMITKEDFFNKNIKLVWKLSPQKETTISSETAWVIKAINKKVWDYVKKWDILATIDLENNITSASYQNTSVAYWNSIDILSYTKESATKDLENTKIALDNAIINQENVYKTTEKQLEITQSQLDNLKNTKNNTESSNEETIKLAEIWVVTAQEWVKNAENNLNNFLQNSEQNKNTLISKKNWIYDSLKVLLDSSLSSTKANLYSADVLLWVSDENKSLNDSYEIYLWWKNVLIKYSAEESYKTAYNQYQKILSTYKTTNDANLESVLESFIVMLDTTYNLYDKLIDTLDTSIICTSLPQSFVDAQKLNISTRQGAITRSKADLIALKNWITDINNSLQSLETNISTTKVSLETAYNIAQNQLKNAKQNLNNIKAGQKINIDNMSGSIDIATKQLESTIVSIQSQRTSVDNAVKIAQAQYESIKAKLDSQISSVKTQLDSVKWQKDIAGIQLEKTKIRATVDGVIMQKNIEVWTLVWAWTPVFVIWDVGWYVVKADVNSENLNYLKLGGTAELWRNWSYFTGTISLISPNIDPITRLYKVEIKPTFTQEQIKSINIWAFIDIYVSTSKTDKKSIFLPFSSIVSGGEWTYKVFAIWSWNIANEIEVKLWDQNDRYIEVIWLTEWQKVITEWALNIQNGDKIEELK